MFGQVSTGRGYQRQVCRRNGFHQYIGFAILVDGYGQSGRSPFKFMIILPNASLPNLELRPKGILQPFTPFYRQSLRPTQFQNRDSLRNA